MENTTTKKSKQRESVQLDEIFKLLFSVSRQTLVNTLNGLFGENFDHDDVEIDISKTSRVHPKIRGMPRGNCCCSHATATPSDVLH